MRYTLSAIAFLAVLQNSVVGQSSRCGAESRIDGLVDDLVSAINVGSPAALSRVVDRHWDSSRLSARRGLLLGALQTWRWRSQHLEKVAACAVTKTSGYALVRNGSRELDSLWIDIDSATSRVNALRIPSFGRLLLEPADTASDASRVAALEAMVRDLANAGIFAGEVLFAKDGRILLHKAVGTIDREANRPARLGEPYNIASVGKMFTGAAIMKLVEEGRLSLDDTLGKFLPVGERSAAAGGVPLKFLLTHTSGIVRGVDTLAFKPGTRFLYSNFEYHLLANVIAAVTGRPFDQYFRTALFEPLGMINTRRLVLSAPDPSLAPNYDVRIDSSGVRLVRNALVQTTPATGAGGMFSTAEDLFRFAEGLRTARLLPRSVIDEMRKPRPEWGAIDYGFGIDRQRGGSIWGHNGYIPGANADLEIYGDSGYVLIVLANLPANEPVRRYAAALLGERANRG